MKNLKAHIRFAAKEVQTRYLFFLLFFTILNGLYPVVYSYLIKLSIDELANVGKGDAGTVQRIFMLTAVTCLFSIGLRILSAAYGYFQQKINRSMHNLFTINLFGRISSLPLSFIETKQGQDALYLAQSAAQISPLEICNNLFQMLQSVITLFSFFTAAVFFSPWMIVVIGVVSLPFFIIEFRFNRIFFLLQKRNSPYYREANYLQQLLIQKETLSELKFFDYQQTICRRIKRMLTFLMKVEMRITKKRTGWQSADEILLEIAYWSYYVWVIVCFIAGKITLGSVTFFSSAYMSLQGTIHSLFMQTNKTLNDGLLLKNYYDVIKAADRTESTGTIRINRIETIRFKNLSFKYPGTEKMILHDVNIEICKGGRVAFIGENGSGKTTMIKLLLGLYPAYAGEILINGKELREYDINAYRKMISVSFQNYQNYFFKIKAMIAMKENNAIDPAILAAAARKSGVEKHIREMPRGYDTVPGYFHEKPLDFSGGQWQKLALARMFYRRGQLRILDEPTSSIDTESEIELYRYFLDNSGDATTIAVTHRIDLLERFDAIFVFHEGSIVEQGSYTELAQRGYLHRLLKQKEELKVIAN